MKICDEKTNHTAEIVYDSTYRVCPICSVIREYKDLVTIEMKENNDLRFKVSELETTIDLMKLGIPKHESK